jgi:hypothetical protein
MKDIRSNILTILSLLIPLLSALYIWTDHGRPNYENKSILGLENIIVLIIPLLTAFYSWYISNTIKRNPKTFTISLLGFPNSGKTVFLTVLFDTLQTKISKNLAFVPYGTETIEKTTKDYNTLTSNNWLPRTEVESVFFYRANATLNTASFLNLFTRRYKIEIPDYAGEKFNELNPSSNTWLHRTDYFDFVISSDAVFLIIDVIYVLDCFPEHIIEYQNSFIAALNVLAEKKGYQETKKIPIPIALIGLKSDVLSRIGSNHVLDKLTKLIDFCHIRCEKFKVFFVSSVGETIYNEAERVHKPPTIIKPSNVEGPLMWALSND